MLRNTLKSAWAHKRRLISTVISVVLGVAFMAGTLVLSDTIDRSFSELFDDVLSETDAEVRGVALIDTGFGVIRAPIDESLGDVVAGVDGVEATAPYVMFEGARILDGDGEPIGSSNGPPTLIQSWIDDEGLAGIELADGRGPEADDELTLNVRAARDAGVEVGDELDLFTEQGTRTFTLVGTYRFQGNDSALGAVTVGITLPVAQELAGLEGQVTSVSARAAEGVSQDELVERIRAALPDDDQIEVSSGEELAQEFSDDFSAGLGFFTILLLVFAFVALIVGAFIIFNTFSILVAQRGKELALQRALGASKRQVLTSVLVEATLVGLVAAVIGLGAGVLLAIGVIALLDAIGLDLPATGLSVTQGAIIAALITGVVVTLGSALVPAWRATRVPPLAALRDVSQDASGRSLVRLAVGIVLLIVAAVAALPALGDDPDSGAAQLVGLSVFSLLVGLLVLGPVIARPMALGLGWVLPRIKGATGTLARENAARNPRRTASTAAALMIGVGLIVFINVFTTSARASVDAELTRGLRAEFIVGSGGWDLTIPRAFSDQVRQVDDVEAVSSVQGWFVAVTHPDGSEINAFVTAIEPEAHLRVVEGEMIEGELTDLVPGTMILDRRVAQNRDMGVGDEMEMVFDTGSRATFTVVAIADEPQLIGTRVIHADDWAEYASTSGDQNVFIAVAEDTDLDAMHETLDEIAAAYPTVDVQDQDEFLRSIADQINALLNVVYGLLFISIIIALIGIANTLSLSIHERTRELGLLRAVGMTRGQVRSAVRWEAAIMSLIGVALGLLIGLVGGYLLVQALRGEGLTVFQIPFGTLAVVAVVFGALGVVASLLPARRAAKLNVLDAIATE
ncbi:MAG: ABC transporter permease [Acidimicrobiales bacterium]